MAGKLFVLPNLLDESQSPELSLPAEVGLAVASLDGLIAESEKGGRRYLLQFLSRERMGAVSLSLLNEHTGKEEEKKLLDPVMKGETWGIVADAGLACIADPGASLICAARKKNIAVKTFAGPSAVVVALQLSGFSGQRFCFHGYLPRDPSSLTQAIIALEKRAQEATQIWIEAPYRSEKMLACLMTALRQETFLSVALALGSPREQVVSMQVRAWGTHPPLVLAKEKAVFLLGTI